MDGNNRIKKGTFPNLVTFCTHVTSRAPIAAGFCLTILLFSDSCIYRRGVEVSPDSLLYTAITPNTVPNKGLTLWLHYMIMSWLFPCSTCVLTTIYSSFDDLPKPRL